jgi:hypothetical protein
MVVKTDVTMDVKLVEMMVMLMVLLSELTKVNSSE